MGVDTRYGPFSCEGSPLALLFSCEGYSLALLFSCEGYSLALPGRGVRLQNHFDALVVAGCHDLALAHVVCDDIAPELVAVEGEQGASDQLDARIGRAIDDVGGVGLDEPGAGFRLLPVSRRVTLGIDEGDLMANALDDDPVGFQAHGTLVDLYGTRSDHPFDRGCVVGRGRGQPADQKIAFYVVGAEVYRLIRVVRQGMRLCREPPRESIRRPVREPIREPVREPQQQ